MPIPAIAHIVRKNQYGAKLKIPPWKFIWTVGYDRASQNQKFTWQARALSRNNYRYGYARYRTQACEKQKEWQRPLRWSEILLHQHRAGLSIFLPSFSVQFSCRRSFAFRRARTKYCGNRPRGPSRARDPSTASGPERRFAVSPTFTKHKYVSMHVYMCFLQRPKNKTNKQERRKRI